MFMICKKKIDFDVRPLVQWQGRLGYVSVCKGGERQTETEREGGRGEGGREGGRGREQAREKEREREGREGERERERDGGEEEGSNIPVFSKQPANSS